MYEIPLSEINFFILQAAAEAQNANSPMEIKLFILILACKFSEILYFQSK